MDKDYPKHTYSHMEERNMFSSRLSLQEAERSVQSRQGSVKGLQPAGKTLQTQASGTVSIMEQGRRPKRQASKEAPERRLRHGFSVNCADRVDAYIQDFEDRLPVMTADQVDELYQARCQDLQIEQKPA